MGFGKKFKRAIGGIGKVAADLTGSKTVGKAVATVVGGSFGSPVGAIGGAKGLSDINSQETGMKNALVQADVQAQQTDALNAQVAEQTRLKLLSEADLKAQEEALKKRTTFAGSSMQGVMERKKLLGI
jgi:hypothetical protein